MLKRDYIQPTYRLNAKIIQVDWPLCGLLLILMSMGLCILYSASNQNMAMIARQSVRLLLALIVMLGFAFIPPNKYKTWAPHVFFIGFGLLIAVMFMGRIGKGAQRWLDIGLFRFQPSEIMKIAVPLMSAWYLDKKPLPLRLNHIFVTALIIFIPAIMIAKQPDLGTALMVMFAGLSGVFLAGISLRFIMGVFLSLAAIAPLIWHSMHGYQKQRILTLLNPEQDPLGTGYHIIQSKIAIGSGGLLGKGWLAGTQSHLNFLPEHATDFIFAVSGEEFGLLGSSLLIIIISLIALRSLHIAKHAQTTFTRLLGTSLAMSFFFSAFVNIGMVMGILPVVGVPLPLVSYGGTAMVTFLAGFGILMSISTHKILFNHVNG
ncbi:MAG: rod shape-determining protein RodA [Legionellaceae bacterium]|nr:rod shape-determining protein RodA [Legionellaceae bacterium]|tara:strand:+ start:1978 stop:3102 length:1125 start_codon:yes stop_codon:yes gene_type:complete